MAIFDAFLIKFFWTLASKCRSCSICKRESEDVPKMPRALIERFTKWFPLRLLKRGRYFANLRSLLIVIFDSKPTVSPNRLTDVLFNIRTRSGVRCIFETSV